MPLYEYECQKGHRTDALSSVAEGGTPRACSECGSMARRVMSSPHFTFGGADGAARTREQIVRRSLAHDQTAAAKDERQATIERLKNSGNIPEGMNL